MMFIIASAPAAPILVQEIQNFGVDDGSECVGQVDFQEPHVPPHSAIFSANNCAVKMCASARPPLMNHSAAIHLGCMPSS